MKKTTFPTPYSNTGSMDTTPIPLRALVDWVSITFLDVKNWQNIVQIMNLNIDDFEVFEQGSKGYTHTAISGAIKILFNDVTREYSGTRRVREDMGIHLNMSGQACREYEQKFGYDIDWSMFFALVLNFRHNVTRLDVAIDDFQQYFTIKQVYSCAKRGCMTATRVKKARAFEEFFIEDGLTAGMTFYVGKGNWLIRFYDKLEERKNDGQEVKVDFWNRYEVQLRSKIATEAMRYLAYTDNELGTFVKGFISAKIDFKVKNKTDKNKSRWKSTKWWLKFLDDVEKLPLTQIAPDMTIEKKFRWFDTQVDKTFAMLLQSFPSERLLIKFLKERGIERITENEKREIEKFKDSPEMQIIQNEINDFLNLHK